MGHYPTLQSEAAVSFDICKVALNLPRVFFCSKHALYGN
jgi:hypothetical protein